MDFGKIFLGGTHKDEAQFIFRALQNRIKQIKGVYYVFKLAAQHETCKVKLYYDSIQGEENEGIVLKHAASTYPASARRCLDYPFWLKVKRPEKHFHN